MKKLLLSLLSVTTIGAFAQADVAVRLASPASGSTIVAGTQFDFITVIKNVGTEPIDASDTVSYQPLVNGSPIGTPQGGNLVYGFTGVSIPAGDSSVRPTIPLNLSGPPSGPVDFCVVGVVSGAGWTGVTEVSTANNQSCANVTWDAGSVSVSEWTLLSNKDNSFYNNNIFHVRMSDYNFTNKTVLNIYNMTGAVVYSTELANSGSSIEEDVNLASLKNGMYIVRINGGPKANATHKILVK